MVHRRQPVDRGRRHGDAARLRGGAGLFLEAAARELEVSVAELRVRDGTIEVAGTDLAHQLLGSRAARQSRSRCDRRRGAEAAGATSAGRQERASARPARQAHRAAYVHDIELPGMVFGRVLRPPSYSATLAAFDAAAIRALPGVVAVVVSGNFIGLCAEREEQAVSALEGCAARCVVAGGAACFRRRPRCAISCRALPACARSCTAGRSAVAGSAQRIEASYSKPYLAHASIGPSCALARYEGGRLTIWSHTQGSHHLRGQIAQVVGVARRRRRRDPQRRRRLLRAQRRRRRRARRGVACPRLRPSGASPMDARGRARLVALRLGDGRVELAASLDATGEFSTGSTRSGATPTSSGPGWGEGINLLAAWHMDPPMPVPPAKDVPQPTGGADRNSIPLYDFPAQEIGYNFIADMPLRVSALRSLGAFANVFAIESFMDELAAAANVDPIEFRLRHCRTRGRAR